MEGVTGAVAAPPPPPPPPPLPPNGRGCGRPVNGDPEKNAGTGVGGGSGKDVGKRWNPPADDAGNSGGGAADDAGA